MPNRPLEFTMPRDIADEARAARAARLQRADPLGEYVDRDIARQAADAAHERRVAGEGTESTRERARRALDRSARLALLDRRLPCGTF